MAKPYIHAKSSAKRYGGIPEDYLDIHNMMDSSKSAVPDNRHRAIYHHSLGCFLMEKIFGTTRQNSEGKTYSVRDIAEQHILEDFGGRFIPTPQDYLQDMPMADWFMNGKGCPRSHAKLLEKKMEKLNYD